MSTPYPIVRCGVRCRCPDLDAHRMPPCWFAQTSKNVLRDRIALGFVCSGYPSSVQARAEGPSCKSELARGDFDNPRSRQPLAMGDAARLLGRGIRLA